MTPDDTPDLTDVAAGGIALAFATGLGLTIGLVSAGALVVAGVRGAHHLVCKEHRP